jgi:hypothetical protein
MQMKLYLAASLAGVGLITLGAYLWTRSFDEREVVARSYANSEQAKTRLGQMHHRDATPQTASVARTSRDPNAQSDTLSGSSSTMLGAPENRVLLPPAPMQVGVDVARLLELQEPKASAVRALLGDEQARVRQMIATERRTFISPVEIEPTRSETDQRIAELLNKQEDELYLDFRQHEIEYGRIDVLDRKLTAHGAGMSRLQRDSLLTAMKDERSAVPAPRASEYDAQTEFQNAMRAWREAYERRIQERTAVILTPAQIAQLEAED